MKDKQSVHVLDLDDLAWICGENVNASDTAKKSNTREMIEGIWEKYGITDDYEVLIRLMERFAGKCIRFPTQEEYDNMRDIVVEVIKL